MIDTAFCVRLQAATLQRVIEVRQANGLSATEWVWLRTDMLALADRVDQGQKKRLTTARR
ncbi:hypothetical protein ABAC460_20320 [Asticcacaulis sp. AC460]|uniref:hypothetical protein n=1 Tax=Asticcacaulis sp. AC460 TaxID=1282360 RepID=UPI0003C3CB74|nr:hypothetical protein [Asticcacaulis sp. AC460]ESQ87371.1 hypothetical protein ABAC460_20320 [Asticcacaulis sp. AC460]